VNEQHFLGAFPSSPKAYDQEDLCVCGHRFSDHRALTKFCTANIDHRHFCPCERFVIAEPQQRGLFGRNRPRRMYCAECHGNEEHARDTTDPTWWQCTRCGTKRRTP